MAGHSIKFGTDGWRAIIGEHFTVANVCRVAQATARWLARQCLPQRVVIGWDTRFGGELFAGYSARAFEKEGIEVVMQRERFVTTPVLSLACRQLGAGVGVMFTASHNPPLYHGYKLKAHFGGPLPPQALKEIEALVEPECFFEGGEWTMSALRENLTELYMARVREHFNVLAISSVPFVYECMYGAGQDVFRVLFPHVPILHGEWNPLFGGVAPEPIQRNLAECIEFMRDNQHYEVALVTDGDADRVALVDRGGEYIDSHHIILLLLHYLVHYKKQRGRVCVAVSVTERVKKYCRKYGLEVEVTPVGFKHIAPKMVEGGVILGGEESGGIALSGHIPERDGLWAGLTVLEWMGVSGCSLRSLIEEVYNIVGAFSYVREDLHVSEEQKRRILHSCERGIDRLNGLSVVETITLDGYKFLLSDESWVMVRASGTEPLVRIYCESESNEKALELISVVKRIVLG